MKLYLARHTQTNYNVQQLCNSDPTKDVHLTKTGLEQAGQLAAQLQNEPIDIIYISELPRTRQTAEIINQYHNVEIIVDGRLNDNTTGYEGRPVRDWYDALRHSDDKWTASFNGGESLEQARLRVEYFINDLKTQPHTNTLVVTHGYIIQCFYGILQEVSNDTAWEYGITQGQFATFDL